MISWLANVAENAKSFTTAFRSLRTRNYRLFWFGQMVSLAGTWMQDIALSWLVLDLSKSPEALGLTMTIRFLPALLFSLYGGVLADRLRKRRTIMWCEGTQAVVALALAVLTNTGALTVAIIYILAGIRGFIDALEGPTRQAFVPEMVSTEDVPNAVALNSTLFNGARVVGPAIGAGVISAFGFAVCFYLNTASFIAVLVALWAMHPRELHITPRLPREGSMRQMWEGLRFIRSSPELVVIFIVMAALGAFGLNFQTLLPLVTKYVLTAGASTLALLTTTMGIGSVVTGLFVAARGRPSQKLFLASSGAFTVFLLGAGLSPWTPLTAVLLFCTGVSATLTMTSANTRLQLGTPGDLRGRVMGMYIVVFIGTTPIGSYLIGFLAERVDMLATVLTIAGLCAVGVVVGAVTAVRHRKAAALPPDVGGGPGGGPGWGADARGSLEA
jgi:MFS family permease